MRQSLEEILMAFFMEHESESFFVQEISEHFGFTASKDFKILVKQLADLEDSGKIVLTRQGKFGFNQKNRTLEGTFRLNDKDLVLSQLKKANQIFLFQERMSMALWMETKLRFVSFKKKILITTKPQAEQS